MKNLIRKPNTPYYFEYIRVYMVCYKPERINGRTRWKVEFYWRNDINPDLPTKENGPVTPFWWETRFPERQETNTLKELRDNVRASVKAGHYLNVREAEHEHNRV